MINRKPPISKIKTVIKPFAIRLKRDGHDAIHFLSGRGLLFLLIFNMFFFNRRENNQTDMITDEKKRTVVQSILQSQEFRDASIHKTLLSYLVDSTLSNEIPKEITIAMDVFGKDSRFNSNKDSTVRYHVHVLRNKLNKYYENEGKEDKIRLMIPKGHYEIKFVSSGDQNLQKPNAVLSFLKRWETVLILILIVLNLILILNRNDRKPVSSGVRNNSAVDPKDKVWSGFFSNRNPVAIVIGDDFYMDEFCPEFNKYRIVRDWDIDSENDLANFLVKHPDANLWKSEITGIPFGGIYNLMDLLPVIYPFQTDVSLYMSSTLSLDQIQNHNVIYIGEFKNLRILNQIIYKTPVRHQYSPEERLYIVENGDTLHTYLRVQAPYEQEDKSNIDYSLLIKIPGFSHENFMFIVGFGYGGRIERTKMLGDLELRTKFIEEIEAANGHVPEYFIALFEVKSIERTGFTNNLKYFKEMPQDILD